jgi:thiamine transport system ATP-binding protein
MLSVQDLTVRFGVTTAVDDVSLQLPTGKVLAVLGPSGCGKSTLLRAIAGLERPLTGTVSYDGQDVTDVPPHKRSFALMFQDGQLFDHRDVAGNVGYALRLRHLPRDEVRTRVAELLELVGLEGYAERRPATLSGGERQRVALARALAAKPRLLLLDEPLSALDRNLRERLATDLRAILTDQGTTALLVTHDQDEAFAVADRMALMRAGRLVQSGTVDEVWGAPVDAEAARFLGYATVVDSAAATRLLGRPTGALALRRSALRVVADGAAVSGEVVAARVTPELLRVEVDVPEVGRLHAVADSQAEVPVGSRVGLAVDENRTAPLSDPST